MSVKDLHQCAERTARELAEFRAFYQAEIVNNELIWDLMSRNQLAAIERAAWKAWNAAKAVTGGKVTSDKGEGV
jgi:hypothetical protein